MSSRLLAVGANGSMCECGSRIGNSLIAWKSSRLSVSSGMVKSPAEAGLTSGRVTVTTRWRTNGRMRAGRPRSQELSEGEARRNARGYDEHLKIRAALFSIGIALALD